jgi:hypothetical protein
MTPAVFVGMASNRGIDPRTVDSLLTVVGRGLLAGTVFGWGILKKSNLSQARTLIADRVEREGASHLLSLDDDGAWPGDLIERLLAHQKPVVSGLCFQRDYPYLPAHWSLDTGQPLDSWQPGLQTSADLGVGMHATLIEVSVFRQLTEHFGDREWFQGQHEDDFFCKRLRTMALARGLPPQVWLDAECKCGHLPADVIVTEQLYRAAKKNSGA